MKAPTKAVIPVAGLGTRFLPATKAMPKEMLPLVDKPVIQYVVEEAVRYGLNDVLFVTGRDKYALENHFDTAEALESRLEERGDADKLEKVQAPANLGNIHYVRQGGAKGLGHAINAARSFTGDEPFAVLLGDDVIEETSHLLERMIEVYCETGASVVALIEVPKSEIHKYGCIKPASGVDGDVVQIADFVEKPKADVAPSNYAVIGRYILRPEIHNILENLEPGAGGEIQLTDALSISARNPELAGGVVGVVFTGERYDAGDKLEYLKATIQLAAKRDDLGPDLIDWMKGYLTNR
jgi:UTP--glucose-1-phosphate uridylyltransferase